MLKHRLIFGTLMTVGCVAVVLLDSRLTFTTTGDEWVQGTLLAILIATALSLGTVELGRLAGAKGLVVLNPPSMIGVILLCTAWYWPQFVPISLGLYLLLVVVLALFGALLQQFLKFGTSGVIGNCGVSCFSMLYLGLLGSFVLGIRVEVGLWAMVMVIAVVKASDIGAYTFGRLFGKHKLAPRVSPGKTWEGLAGAAGVGMAVSFAFALVFGIMTALPALGFGACLAVVGQFSDLVESMLKRDAGWKDSSNRVPGFGGILDVIDSPLFATPFAYVFLKLAT
jgi:phosphatidate cytidylyltransferase